MKKKTDRVRQKQKQKQVVNIRFGGDYQRAKDRMPSYDPFRSPYQASMIDTRIARLENIQMMRGMQAEWKQK